MMIEHKKLSNLLAVVQLVSLSRAKSTLFANSLGDARAFFLFIYVSVCILRQNVQYLTVHCYFIHIQSEVVTSERRS